MTNPTHAQSTGTNNSEELEQTLNKTDFGHFIYEYRSLFISLVLASILSVSGFALWKQYQSEKDLELSAEVFHFQSNVWDPVQDNKKDAADLSKKFLSLDKKVQTSPTMVPLVLEMVKFLFEKGYYSDGEKMLSAVSQGKYHSQIDLFISLQRAVVLEKLNKIDEAISLLLPLAQKANGMFASELSLELGRLYLEKGNKDKAKAQFDHILSQFPNDEAAKMAGLYLMELGQ